MKNLNLKFAAVLPLVLFVLAGCGGDSSSTPATTTTTVAAATTTTTIAAATTTTTGVATTTTTTTTTTQVAQTTTGSTAFGILSTSTSRIAILPTSVGGSSGTTGKANGVELVSLGSLTASSKASVKAASSSSSGGFIPVTFSDGNGPDACSVDSSVLKAVCIELASAQIVILDLSKYAVSGAVGDVVASQLTLSDLPSTQTSFSGVSCVDCGVVTIPSIALGNGAPMFVIAGYDGYHTYNYPAASATAISATKVYNVPISENLAIDATTGWLIAPGYYSGVTGGRQLYIINLIKGSMVAWTQATDSCNETDATQLSLCQSLATEEIDSFSVDPGTQILTLQSESGNELLQLDLSQISYSGSTFTAPHLFVSGQNATNGNEMSGAISSPAGDYLFIAAEFGDAWIGVANLPTSGGAKNAFPAYTFYPVYVNLTTLVSSSSGSCTTFTGGYDPHREATAISLGGAQFGVYASGDGTCLATVNLSLLAAAPHTVSPNLVDSTYNLIANGVITFTPVSSATSTVASQPRKNYFRHAQEVHRH